MPVPRPTGPPTAPVAPPKLSTAAAATALFGSGGAFTKGSAKAPSPVVKPVAPPKVVTSAPRLATKLSTTGRLAAPAPPRVAPLTGLTPAIKQAVLSPSQRAAADKANAMSVVRGWGNGPAAAVATDIYKPVEAGLTVGGKALGSAATAVSNEATSIRNTLSKGIGLGGGNTAQGGGFPSATIAPSVLAQQVTLNAVKDAVNLPAEVIPSTYFTAKAAIAAATGHPAALVGMGKQIANQLTTAKGWENHPLNNFLTITGALHGIGRAGAAVRSAAGLSDASVLTRPDEVLYANARTPQMPYSRDPLIRARQKASDKISPPILRSIPAGRATFAGRVGKQVDETYGTNATMWRNQRNEIVRQRQEAVTARHSPGAQLRQAGSNALNPRRPLLRPEIVGKEAVNLIAQGVIRKPDTIRPDVQKAISMVEAVQHPAGSAAEKAQAETLGRLHAILNDRAFQKNPHAAFTAARKFAQDTTPLQKKLVDRGYISQDAVDHAKLVPYAITHMGAKHDVTEEALAHDAARAAVSKAQRDLSSVEKSLANAQTPAEHVAGLALAHAKRAALEDARKTEAARAVPKSDRLALVHPEGGKRVTVDEVRTDMKAAAMNPDHVGFITHRHGTDAQARWGSLATHALGETKERTGEAFRGGLTDLSHEAVVRQHLMSALQVHRHDSTNRILNRFVVRKLAEPGKPVTGDFVKREDAIKAAGDQSFRQAHNIPEGVKLEPYRLAPQFVRKSQLTAIKSGLVHAPEDFFDESKVTGEHYTPTADALKATEPGSYGLIAKDAADRLRAHEQPASTAGRLARSSASLFRKSTLPFSPKRVVGLPQETAIRLLVGRAGVTSRIFEHRFENALNRLSDEKLHGPEGATAAKDYLDTLAARTFGGQQSGQAIRLQTHNVIDYYRGTPFEGGARLLHNLGGVPTIGHVMAAFRATANGILHYQKVGVEQQAAKAAVGKAALVQLKQTTGYSWPRALLLHTRAVEDFAKGQIESQNQDAYGRYLDTMMGKWSNQSPLMTKVLAVSPFLSWYVNSLRFLYGTLPADHPVITGLLAASNTATAGARAQYGLSGPLSGNPLETEGYTEGGIPLSGGRMLDLAHYSPFGAVSDIAGSAKSELPPLITEPATALLGDTYTGQYPKNAAGQRVEPPTSQKLQMAFTSLLDTILPGYSVAERGASKPSGLISPFRIYKNYPIQQQPTGFGVTPTDLGTSRSALGISNTELGIP